MNKKKYFINLSLYTLLVLAMFSFAHYINWVQLTTQLFWCINISIFTLFIGGGAIIAIGKKKIQENLAPRFLIMTTFHFLAIFALLIAVWYTSKQYLRAFSLQFISVFLSLMVIHSILLIKISKKDKY